MQQPGSFTEPEQENPVFPIQKEMSIREAWEQFGFVNGAASYEKLRRKAVDVLGDTGDILNCLVCGEFKILDLREYLQLPPNVRATKNPEDYREGSQSQIESALYRSHP
jgi:hypothetical protein